MQWRSMGAMGSSKNALCTRAIVALGNPYRTDDGAGIALLRLLRGDGLRVMSDGHNSQNPSSPIAHHPSQVDLIEAVHDGVRLAEAMRGYGRVLIVDAAPWLPVGGVRRYSLQEFPARAGYFHGVGLRAALDALKLAGEEVPEVEVLAIGVPADPPFGEGLSPEVEAALPRALEEVERWLKS